MKKIILTIVCMCPLWLGSCVVNNLGQSIKATLKGDYWLSTKKYAQGEKDFQEEVARTPGNAGSYYYLGRFQLAGGQNKAEAALKNFQKAVSLSPDNTNYLFWLGVAYGAVNKPDDEGRLYRQVLQKKADHLQALIYLGHNRFEAGAFTEALDLYTHALKLWPFSPSALFNRGLIMRKLGRTPEEKQAWLAYLDVYPSGAMARKAVDYVNSLGDFHYRNQRIGARTVTIEKIHFEPFSDVLSQASLPSLNLIGTVFSSMKNRELHIVVYQKNNRKLAEKRAKRLKRYLLENNKGIQPARIRLSWFANSEEITVLGGKTFQEGQSVSFFTKKM